MYYFRDYLSNYIGLLKLDHFLPILWLKSHYESSHVLKYNKLSRFSALHSSIIWNEKLFSKSGTELLLTEWWLGSGPHPCTECCRGHPTASSSSLHWGKHCACFLAFPECCSHLSFWHFLQCRTGKAKLKVGEELCKSVEYRTQAGEKSHF